MKMLNLIEGLEKFGMNSEGCLRMQALCKALGDPQRELKFIHVGGTNGKGSTCHMLASILEEQMFKVGMYISPALYEFNERITINKEKISVEQMDEYYTTFKEVLKGFEDHPLGYPTEFEVVTALAFMYFKDQKVDYVVLEVGLGGRFDATNVITPLVCAITNIDLDHTQILGDTIEEIAFEKAGIIKENTAVVLGSMDKGAIEVISDVANNKKAPILRAFESKLDLMSDTLNGQDIVYKGKKMTLALLGKHQLENLKVVLEIVEILKGQGINITFDAISKGLKNTSWPGRFERISLQGKTVIFDVAHNPNSMEVLKDNLIKYYPTEKLTFVLGIFKDKDIEAILLKLKDLNPDIYLTKPLGDRALDTKDLKVMAQKIGLNVVGSNDDLISAFTSTLSKESKFIIVCGSFNTVGPIRAYLNK